MNLQPEEAQLFFKLYFRLLAYANRRMVVIKNVTQPDGIKKLDKANTTDIRDKLYKNPELIAQFVAENPENLLPEELAIISGWQHFIFQDFFILKFLKKYSVLLSSEKIPHLYGLIGLNDPLETITQNRPLPILIQTVLLPFQGRVIYDGLIRTYNLVIGSGIQYELNETYRRLKAKEGIIESLLGTDGQPQIVTNLSNRRPASPAPDWRPAVDDIVALTEKMRKADSPLQRDALSLLRATACLAQSMLNETDQSIEYNRHMKSVQRALKKLENQMLEDEFYND
jgi:hypothetical protein